MRTKKVLTALFITTLVIVFMFMFTSPIATTFTPNVGVALVQQQTINNKPAVADFS